jgi:methionine-rich copper-binding protein CopC
MSFAKRVIQVAALLCIIVPYSALAHATPISYTPLAGSTELTTPASISIRFTERIEVGASSLAVYGPDNELVNEGKGSLDAQDSRILSVPINDGKEGVYTVSWQVVSVDDGHFTKGAYSFLVDQTGAVYEGHQGGVDVSYSSKLPDAYLGFMQLIGESLFIGVLGFLFLTRYTSLRKKYIDDQSAPRVNILLLDLVILGRSSFYRKYRDGLCSQKHRTCDASKHDTS